ncbi:hypothetical protein S7335_5388 [Synechococcus sp. PCC 7335]|uniref:hypothetical protein n=1 Tax=Synechococcus sp. (strain ATCC 29403 / PCC 7335) TaxID=91464 RepID=UPI00017EB0D4|nr:hypothetical protein [Synechococcus sp. PCC 7335]EDX87678.1 hypothetical protein S7335_5388 [Synechococcus sp. PCC 7335]
MTRKLLFTLLWLGFSLYAFTLAPPFQPGTFDQIIRLVSGQWEGLNPSVVALFNLMGVWPMIYACLALIDGTTQKIPAWPFVLVSFGVGAFAILPYLALRESHVTFDGPKTVVLKLVDSVWTGRAIALASIILLVYGITSGDWSDFARQWQTSQFIHVMSLDFCMLCAIVWPLLKDDMAKRNLTSPALFWSATLIPLLGIAFYLSIRPPLETAESASLQSPSIT